MKLLIKAFFLLMITCSAVFSPAQINAAETTNTELDAHARFPIADGLVTTWSLTSKRENANKNWRLDSDGKLIFIGETTAINIHLNVFAAAIDYGTTLTIRLFKNGAAVPCGVLTMILNNEIKTGEIRIADFPFQRDDFLQVEVEKNSNVSVQSLGLLAH